MFCLIMFPADILKFYLEISASASISIGIGDGEDEVLSNLQRKYRKLNRMGSNRNGEHYVYFNL